jgi:hypothetical protein
MIFLKNSNGLQRVAGYQYSINLGFGIGFSCPATY